MAQAHGSELTAMVLPVNLPPPPREIVGRRLRLRDVRIEDANHTYAGWMNDPEVVRYTESRYVRHSPESLRDFIETVAASRHNLFLAITKKDNARHIGNIKLGNINDVHGTADIGIIIGDKSCWGRGYASEAVSLLADYAFATVGLHKLTAGCYAANESSARAFEKAGFKIEGVLKEHCLCDDERIDVLLLVRLRTDECGSAGSGK